MNSSAGVGAQRSLIPARARNLARTLQARAPQDLPAAVFLLLLNLVAFGGLITELGFYWDDWETILVAQQLDDSFYWSYFQGTRPLAAWSFLVLAPILGVRPLAWHITTLLLRYLATMGFYSVLTITWPGARQRAALAAALFSVYPLFRQQAISVAFHQHWLAYALFFLSVYAMLRAARGGRWLGWTTLSIFAQILHLGLMEYFVGVELLRPLLLYAALRFTATVKRQSARRTILYWLPNLAVLLLFIAWRISLSLVAPSSGDRPVLLFQFFESPLLAAGRSLRFLLQDTAYGLITTWYDVISPELLDFDVPSEYAAWFVAVIAGGLTGLAILAGRRMSRSGNEERLTQEDSSVFLALGFAAFLLGLLPIWATGRQAIGGLFANRVALPAMFGAAMVWIGGLQKLTSNWRSTTVIVIMMVGLASGLHFRVANDFRWSWTKQLRFYWQLYWRAPYIGPSTVVLSDGDIFPFVRPTFSINLLYLEPRDGPQLAYWYYILGRELPVDPLGAGVESVDEQYRGLVFEAQIQNSLVIFYEPPMINCLWVIESRDIDDRYLPSSIVRTARLTNLDRIMPQEAPGKFYPPREIFGAEPGHDWCYYYQKAALAEQFSRWEELKRLANEALEAGYWPTNTGPSSPHEWLPLIHGLALTGLPQKAKELTLASFEVNRDYRTMLCNLWESFPSASDQIEFQRQQISQHLGCQD